MAHTNAVLSFSPPRNLSHFYTYSPLLYAVKFYNELKGRDIKRFTTVVVGAMGAAAVIYAIAMTLGFETFGLASK
eukprot:12897-Eustigmatos_ZCMA.PRE.1